MEIAGGVLGWSEEQFWQSSPQYFKMAIEGFKAKNGIKQSDLTQNEYEEFKENHSAELALTSDDLARMREKANNGSS